MYYTIVPFWYTTSQQPLHPRLQNPGSATAMSGIHEHRVGHLLAPHMQECRRKGVHISCPIDMHPGSLGVSTDSATKEASVSMHGQYAHKPFLACSTRGVRRSRTPRLCKVYVVQDCYKVVLHSNSSASYDPPVLPTFLKTSHKKTFVAIYLP